MKLLNKEGNEITSLDLGIVKAGEKQEYSYILYNETPRKVIDINITIEDSEVEVVNTPKQLNGEEKKEIKIVWSPSLKIKKGLKSLIKITATELYQ